MHLRALIVVGHLLAAFSLCGSITPRASAEPSPPIQQLEPNQPAAVPIPIPEIAQRAEQVGPILRSAERTVPGSEVEDIEAALPSAKEWIRGRLAGTAQTLASSPSPNAMMNLTDSWRVMRSKLAGWNGLLTRRATQLE